MPQKPPVCWMSTGTPSTAISTCSGRLYLPTACLPATSSGEFELDESYFGARRQGQKRPWGSRKNASFGPP